ncbi:MAG: type II secretion system protein GspN [Dissulfurispiraceae bacterium]
MKKIIFAISVFFILAVSVWIIAIPERMILELTNNILSEKGMHVISDGFEKGLFYNFSAQKILLSKTSGLDAEPPLFTCDNVKGGMNLISVFKLAPTLVFKCSVNNGVVTGDVRLTGAHDFTSEGQGIDFKGIHFLEHYGVSGDGRLSWNMRLVKESGEITFSIADAKLQGISVMRFLPLNLFQDIKGLLLISNGVVEVRSLALKGDGIYARMRGTVSADKLDLTMELMVNSLLKADSLILKALESYRVSPGYYVVPLQQKLPM